MLVKSFIFLPLPRKEDIKVLSNHSARPNSRGLVIGSPSLLDVVLTELPRLPALSGAAGRESLQ